MLFKVEFSATDQRLPVDFGAIQNISDGGYERGYAEGETVGYKKGHTEGYAEGETVGYKNGKADGITEGSGLLKALAEGTIEEINDDTITTAKQFIFQNCISLKTATLNNLTTAGTSFFGGCAALETVKLPSLKQVPYTGFTNCTSLKNVYVPNAEGNFGCFYSCNALEFIDLPKFTYVHASVFEGCSSLKTVVLRYSKVMTLNNVSAFGATPFRNGEGGTIYVPQALVESYKTATNWNALESATFLPIEGSEYE